MNSHRQYRRYRTLALALVAALNHGVGLAASDTGSGSSADAPVAKATDNGEIDSTLPTPQEGAVMAEFGRGVLAHVDAAASSLADEDSAQALLELASARKLLEQIQTNTRRDLIPVFARIGLTRRYTLSEETQARLQAVADLALQGDHERVVALLEATGAPMGYIHVSMPLASTMEAVDGAIQALYEDRPGAAQGAMDRIIDNLHTNTVTVGEDSPAGTG